MIGKVPIFALVWALAIVLSVPGCGSDEPPEIGGNGNQTDGGDNGQTSDDGRDAGNGNQTDADNSTGTASECQEACQRVYDECEIFLLYANEEKVPESGCVDACRDGYFAEGPECLETVECDDDELNEQCVAVDIDRDVDVGEVDPQQDWPTSWAAFERQVFALINLHRDRGWECGEQSMDSVERLEFDEAISRAARGHSLEMVRENFYDHTGSDGSSPGQRMNEAGYDGTASGEIINRHFGDPFAAMISWLDSDSHCVRIMQPDFTHVGAGFVPDADSEYGDRWTVNFGAGGP